ncbi:hypothetical protein HDU83_005229 [Entophlyctis luteolus]|nr:hypothetical protein HDU83_005229 [Entophlyctis luteolus]
MTQSTQREEVPSLSAAARLRAVLAAPGCHVMPCCYDGLSARMIERRKSAFKVAFMTGFGVSAVHGLPDTQLISYAEMLQSATNIGASLTSVPCIADADTGYGGPVNVKRTVRGYIQAGMAGIMIEDQVSPKRCGHTRGKAVVPRDEAYARIRAAVDARAESGRDIVIMARTDARACVSLDEAIARCIEFRRIGADITFLEAPRDVAEMRRYCREVDGPKMANMIERGGLTPVCTNAQLAEMGFKLAAYPLTLLAASIKAMDAALLALASDTPTDSLVVDFETSKDVVGFNEFYAEDDRYKVVSKL